MPDPTPAPTTSRTDVWIPMADGARLAATLYLPAGVTQGASTSASVPCLLEALPYRKDDFTASYRPEYTRFRDEFGYAVARVDLRGTGSSDGIALDEYHAQEQSDLHEVIAWLAAQPWCSGAVGMFGTSWSGFNALQLATERPPALRAIVATYATDDRFTDDVHYMGGALRLLDQVDYPLYMVAMNALPPVPALYGPLWREQWLRRIEQTPPWILGWLRENADGPYWRHGSVRPGYDRIACPTLIVAGWADGYRNNTFRTFEALSQAGTPVHVLAGPWSHMSPATSVPGPHVDHVPVMARWWDRWLREEPNGVDAEPGFTVFVRSYASPEPDAPAWPGRWEAHDRASLAAATPLELPLADATVRGAAVDARGVAGYAPVLDVGVTAWNSCAASLPWGQPEDQTPDDARSLVCEWTLPPGTVVLGHPRLRLRVRLDHDTTHVSAKLALVPAAGRPSLLVDRGLVVVTGSAGDWVDVDLELEAAAFEAGTGEGEVAGERLRLALACADWPNTVAPPGTWSAVDLTASTLVLPVSAGTPHPAPQLPAPPPVAPAEQAGHAGPDGSSSHVRWQHGYDVLTRTRYADVDHGSSYPTPAPTSAQSGVFARCVEHYVGHVEVDARTGRQLATATTRFELSWPDADPPVSVTTVARLHLGVEAGQVEARVELDVHEGEGDGLRVVARPRWSSSPVSGPSER